MFANKQFIYTDAYISKSKQCYNAKPSAYYFYLKAKIYLDFYICISVSLSCDKENYSLCDFVVRDIKIAVYLESPRKINFNLVSDFLSKIL